MSNRTMLAGLGLVLVLAMAVGWHFRPRGEEPLRTELRELSRDRLELRDDVLYALGESEAFEGTMVEMYPDRTKRIAIEIRGGKAHGVSRGWYENGQLEVEEHFVRGVSHGKRTRWYANGALKSEAQIVDGKVEGVFTRWHDNGVKAALAIMVDGTPHGVSEAWYPSGAPKSRVVLESGEVVSREYFDDENTF